jgi:hypothetical protein
VTFHTKSVRGGKIGPDPGDQDDLRPERREEVLSECALSEARKYPEGCRDAPLIDLARIEALHLLPDLRPGASTGNNVSPFFIGPVGP